MTKRKDGKKTRLKLLNVACEVFAQKGYRDARVSEICKRAGTNLASVNYYFGDKNQLYGEAWQHALDNMKHPALSDPAAGSAEDRLREYIQALIQNFTAQGELGWFNRLYLMEMVNPTGLIQDAWHETIEPRRQILHDIIREISGSSVSDLDVRFCELSIINQCRIFVTMKQGDLEYMLGQSISPELIRRLATHIADFSMVGIKAVGRHKS